PGVPVAGHRAADADVVTLVGRVADVDRRPQLARVQERPDEGRFAARALRGGGRPGGSREREGERGQRREKGTWAPGEHAADDSGGVRQSPPVVVFRGAWIRGLGT